MRWYDFCAKCGMIVDISWDVEIIEDGRVRKWRLCQDCYNGVVDVAEATAKMTYNKAVLSFLGGKEEMVGLP